MPDFFKFQVLLIYTTKGSSVHGHVIVAYVQKKYSCSSWTCRPTWKIGLFLEVQGVIHNYGQEKSPGLRSDGVILLRDNVWLHVAQHTQNLLQICGWEPLDCPP